MKTAFNAAILATAICALLASANAQAASAAALEQTTAEQRLPQTTIEYYYRIKWGSLDEFVALYTKNHKPLLEEAKKAGLIVSMTSEYPFTHMAGGPRWDMRVTIVYRDAAAAINDPAWESVWEDAKARLYKDKKKFKAEEDRRFSLLEDHWDVIVMAED